MSRCVLSPTTQGNLTMQRLLRSSIFILLAIAFQLLGCSEETDNDPVIPKTKPTPPELTPETTFENLKILFPRRIFDTDFVTLGEVISSKPYLDFLTEEYQMGRPFKTLEEYFKVAEPDPERYKPFLKESIENPQEKDINVLHQIVMQYRCANAVQYEMIHDRNLFGALFLPIGKKLAILEEPPIQAWLDLHFPGWFDEGFENQDFFIAIDAFVIETEKEDVRFIQKLFEKHGKDDGLLWLALRHPILTAEILNNFTNTVVFQEWIDGKYFPPER